MKLTCLSMDLCFSKDDTLNNFLMPCVAIGDQPAAQQHHWVGARIGANSAELVLGQGPTLRVLTSTHFSGAGTKTLLL